MELRQLVYLDAVARHGGFTRAALELNVAQSAVSAQIARLERELGAVLMLRDRRGARPTHHGKLVLRRARRVLAELDGLQTELAAAGGSVRGAVRLGALPVIGSLDVPALVAAFLAEHPEVDVSLWEGTAAETWERLRADDLDAAYVAVDAGALPAGVAGVPAGAEELVVACAPGHELAGLERIHLGLLAGEPLVATPPGSGLRLALEELLAAEGLTPHVAFASNHLSTVRALVAQGLGVGLLPRGLATAAGPPLAALAVDPGPARLPLTLSWRAARRMPPAVEAFLAFATRRRAGGGIV